MCLSSILWSGGMKKDCQSKDGAAHKYNYDLVSELGLCELK